MLNKSGKNNFQISSCNSQTFLHCNNRLLNKYISDTANKIIPLSTCNLKTTNYLENVFNIIEINHYLSIYVFFFLKTNLRSSCNDRYFENWLTGLNSVVFVGCRFLLVLMKTPCLHTVYALIRNSFKKFPY
jgi:hypothetical protein